MNFISHLQYFAMSACSRAESSVKGGISTCMGVSLLIHKSRKKIKQKELISLFIELLTLLFRCGSLTVSECFLFLIQNSICSIFFR